VDTLPNESIPSVKSEFIREYLQDAGMPDNQSTALARILDELATRSELQNVEARLRGEMQSLRAELRGEMQALSAELRGEMQALRAELRGEMQTLRAEIRAELHAEMSGLRTYLVGRLYASMAFFALAMALLDRFID
jgi:hypothetical protein